MNINQMMQEVYEQAVALEYPKTPCRSKAISEIIKYIPSGGVIYDFCPQEKEILDQRGDVLPLYPDQDMHLFLDKMQPLEADMIIVRHVAEHSIMPYVLLKLLKKHTKTVLLIVPEDNKHMIHYNNHFSVFSKEGWQNLFKKSGWGFKFLGEAQFQSTGAKEWRYLLTCQR